MFHTNFHHRFQLFRVKLHGQYPPRSRRSRTDLHDFLNVDGRGAVTRDDRLLLLLLQPMLGSFVAIGNITAGESLDFALQSDTFGAVDVDQRLLHCRRVLQPLYLYTASPPTYRSTFHCIVTSVSVRLSLWVFRSVRPHISKTARRNFIRFSVHVTYAVARTSSGGVAKCHVVPVLWITLLL